MFDRRKLLKSNKLTIAIILLAVVLTLIPIAYSKLFSKTDSDSKIETALYILNTDYYEKEVKLDDENFLEFALRYNYKNQVSLHISKFYQAKGKEYASTNGMGKSRILEEVPVKRKSINNLIKFTKDLNDEKLLEINKNTKMATGYGLIESSENF